MKEWAEKNRTIHNQIRQYISDCHWPRLAERLCRDLKELLNVVPPDTATMYENVLFSIQTEYFGVMSRDVPEYWVANEKTRKLTEEKLVREGEEAGSEIILVDMYGRIALLIIGIYSRARPTTAEIAEMHTKRCEQRARALSAQK